MTVSLETPAQFFIVGAPKCGTTAWWSYLANDPDVFLPAVKEVHHYTDDLLDVDHKMQDPSYYLTLFREARSGQLVGQAGVFHLYSRNAAANIKRARPDAKIVAMLRNPVDLMYSFHSQLVYSGEEPITDFREALLAETGRKAGRLPVPATNIHGKLFYRDVAMLDVQVHRYLDIFGPDQLHIVIFDDIRADPLAALNATRNFLGLQPLDWLDLAPVNANKEARSKALRDLFLYRPSPTFRRIGRFIPDQARWKLRQALLRRNSRVVARPPLSGELRHQLTLECEPVVERLANIIGRDLGTWCSPHPD